jgi:heme-degrading monooxygenase HmoA
MVIVVFRSRLREEAREEYEQLVEEIDRLAEAMPGFLAKKTFTAPDGERASIIEFESEEALLAWRNHPRHLAAQQRGREAFYAWYRVQVCTPLRSYAFTFTRSDT